MPPKLYLWCKTPLKLIKDKMLKGCGIEVEILFCTPEGGKKDCNG
jgi:hypothetical protein